MSQLPEGWAESDLGAVTVRVPSVKPATEPLREFGYVDISAIDRDRKEIVPTELRRFLGNAAPSRARRPIRGGDILFSNVRTNLGNVALVPDDLPAQLCSTGFTVLRTNGAVVPEYLLRWTLTDAFVETVSETQTGTHYPATSDSQVLKQRIHVAPLPEQHRIVEKVEALLEQVNRAKARLARVPLILRRFRQAVLAAACSGRLTEEWRATADKSDGYQPSGWRRLALEDVASRESRSIQSGPFGSNLLHSEFTTKGKLVIGIDNVGDGEFLPGRQNRISDAKFQELERYAARAGDVLVTVMATVGRVCVVPDDIEPAIITKHVYRVTTNQTIMLPQFLTAVLRGDSDVLQQVHDQIRGQTRPGINGQILKSLELPVPPLSEQHEIVRLVVASFALADAIERRVATAAAHAEKLTPAILCKAFSGELIPTEAELARAEGRDYEPASALLERVRREAPSEPPCSSRRLKRTMRPSSSEDRRKATVSRLNSGSRTVEG